MARLHALLVGINEYQYLRHLRGCVGDVERMEQCLRTYFPDLITERSFRRLTNQEATKAGIVRTFREQLTGDHIQAGDTVLFFFSGHGGEEKAAPVFQKTNPNGRLENLACQDSNLERGEHFLADKELRFLLGEAARDEVEVVAIFDCCHAGDNTRSIEGQASWRLTGLAEQRPWTDFLFADRLSESDFEKAAVDTLLPQGRHIQLAACGSHELAAEDGENGGVFTTALIKTLEQFRGHINYYELGLHAQRQVKRGFEQHPQVYVYAGNTQSGSAGAQRQALFRNFLSSQVQERPIQPGVYFNTLHRQWVMDVGAVYGVSKMWKGEEQRIPIFSDNRPKGKARIEEVYAGHTVLSVEEDSDLIPIKTYRAELPSLLSRGLAIALRGDSESRPLLEERINNTPGLWLTTGTAPADFTVFANGGEWRITLPGDDRPLTQVQTGYGADQADTVIRHLQAIGKWWFVRHLKNQGTQLGDSALSIAFYANDKPLAVSNQVLRLPMTGQSFPGVRFTVSNTTDRPLYLAVLSLSSRFGIDAWVDDRVTRLEGGKSLSFGSDFFLEEFIIEDNWPEERGFFSFIASDSPFEIDLLLQAELEAPARKSIDQTRGGPLPAVFPPDWRTFLLEVQMPNPFFK